MVRMTGVRLFFVLFLIAGGGCTITTPFYTFPVVPKVNAFDRPALKKVKRVAVLIFNMPLRTHSDTSYLLYSTIRSASFKAVDAQRGYSGFVQALWERSKVLGFEVLSEDSVRENAAFAKLLKDRFPVATLDRASGVVKIAKSSTLLLHYPPFLRGFGEKPREDSALVGTVDEASYLKDAIKALGLDGAIVVFWHFPEFDGFLFTKLKKSPVVGLLSDFRVSVVDKNGTEVFQFEGKLPAELKVRMVLKDRTNATQQLLWGPMMLLPERGRLMENHGRRMGRLFADSYTDALSKPATKRRGKKRARNRRGERRGGRPW